MPSADDLLNRIVRLETIAALNALKAEYATAADAKYTPDRQRRPDVDFAVAAARQAACFTEDALWDGGPFGGLIRGRSALRDFFSRSPWRFTAHLYSAPVFIIGENRTEAHWRLWELGVREPDGRTVLVTGRTHETYRQTPEGWKVATMRFDTLHSLALSSAPDALRCLIPAGEAA